MLISIIIGHWAGSARRNHSFGVVLFYKINVKDYYTSIKIIMVTGCSLHTVLQHSANGDYLIKDGEIISFEFTFHKSCLSMDNSNPIL